MQHTSFVLMDASLAARWVIRLLSGRCKLPRSCASTAGAPRRHGCVSSALLPCCQPGPHAALILHTPCTCCALRRSPSGDSACLTACHNLRGSPSCCCDVHDAGLVVHSQDTLL
jgi:hypothetical protein